MDCIFCKIANHEIPTKFFWEDKDVVAFSDINPISPVHILIVPKEHIRDFMGFNNSPVLEKVRDVIQKIIKDQKLEDRGYRIVVNGGGAQVIDHLHFHLIGPLGKAVPME